MPTSPASDAVATIAPPLHHAREPRARRARCRRRSRRPPRGSRCGKLPMSRSAVRMPAFRQARSTGADALPGRCVGDVEAGSQVERLDLVSLSLEPLAHRAADAALAAGDDRASRLEDHLADVLARLDQRVRRRRRRRAGRSRRRPGRSPPAPTARAARSRTRGRAAAAASSAARDRRRRPPRCARRATARSGRHIPPAKPIATIVPSGFRSGSDRVKTSPPTGSITTSTRRSSISS